MSSKVKPVENTDIIQEQTTSRDYEFSRSVVESFSDNVKVTDTDGNLELFCYTKCKGEDNELLQQCRGVVFDGEKIVMKAFPYTIELGINDTYQFDQDFSNYKVYDAYEGFLIRMFHYENKWYVCTHRKLNAFRSKWASSESFGTLFKKALETEKNRNEDFATSLSSVEQGENILDTFQNTLDTTKQYMFLVSHSKENRIVSSTPESPFIYHVGTFIDGELNMDETLTIGQPTKHSFDNAEQMRNYVSNINIKKLQGVIVFAPNNKQYKVFNNQYTEFFKVRGNEPSIKFRYLQVRMNKEQTDMLYYLYPDMAKVFDDYENALYSIATTIYDSYVQRHIKHNWSTLPTQEYVINRICHKWHESNKKKNKVSLDKVINVMNEQSATLLNAMIRRYFNDKNKKDTTNKNIQVRKKNETVELGPVEPTETEISSIENEIGETSQTEENTHVLANY